MTSLLVIEDNPKLSRTLKQGLAESGYEVTCASTLNEGFQYWQQYAPQVILLDLGLPDGDGLDMVRRIRSENQHTLILILTARDPEADRVEGLNLGADDYILKPFSFPELLARLHRHLQRAQNNSSATLMFQGISLDLSLQQCRIGEEAIVLTPREFMIMVSLVRARGKSVSRETITQEIWPDAVKSTTLQNLLDVHMFRLRDKLRETHTHPVIETIRGLGYCLKDNS